MAADQCVACGSSNWRRLPEPGTGLMLTTAGTLVATALCKSQCGSCGAVQRLGSRLADTDYYERQYTYYDRPGARAFDVVRYRALARWIEDAVLQPPQTVLDVGCGQGGTMQYLRETWPEARFAGIEPSTDAAAAARALGFAVREGRLTGSTPVSDRFDLVFSNNVLQHTGDPVEFVQLQSRLLSSNGRLVLSCSDGTKPSVELLMADQNFSLCPPHVNAIASKAGMQVERRLPCPGGPLRNEQLAVLRPKSAQLVEADTLPQQEAIEAAYEALVAYLGAWAGLDGRLLDATGGASRVFNFGGGLWSYVLAAYCPQYWARVECCLVDGFAGRCIDRQVKPFESVALTADDVLVLGTNPYVQPKLAARFSELGLRAVAWNEVIAD